MAIQDSKRMSAITSKDDIQIELSTRPALRLWSGREKTDQKHGILGLPGFSKMMRGIETSIQNDDPYADFYYFKIEEAIDYLSQDLDAELKDIEEYLHINIPSAMKLPDVGSKEPTLVPVRFASKLGFQMVYQVLKVDQISLKVLLANHVGLLPNKEKFQTLARLEKKVRAVLHMIFEFRHTEVTRDDMAVNNQRATKAIEIMGRLESCYLDGSTRSPNAPKLPISRIKALVGKDTQTDLSDENMLDKAIDAVLEGA